MGNMLSLRRKGLQDGGAFGEMDNVSFVYNGNQLIKAIIESNPQRYKDAWNFIDDASASIEYEYDANGNLTKDMIKEYVRLNIIRWACLLAYCLVTARVFVMCMMLSAKS